MCSLKGKQAAFTTSSAAHVFIQFKMSEETKQLITPFSTQIDRHSSSCLWESHNTKNNKIIIIKSVFSHNNTGTRNKLDPDNSANLKPPQLQGEGGDDDQECQFEVLS